MRAIGQKSKDFAKWRGPACADLQRYTMPKYNQSCQFEEIEYKDTDNS